MLRQPLSLVVFALLITAVQSTFAKGPKYTDPAKADADFAIQGEYSGELESSDGKEKFGVQVIAQGGGKFRVVGYHGGLPGDGWNGEDPVKVEGEFQAKDGVLIVQDKHGRGVIENGVMTCDLGDDGKTNGKLKKVVRKSSTLGEKAPKGAVVLFDGSNADNWENGRVSDDGVLMEGTHSKQEFGSHKLHIEFRLPYQPEDRGQGRGNSGIYVQGRYEVQMLDSFGLDGKHNECGGIYSVKDPDVNMCYPPLSWQTYDIEYTAAKFDPSGKLVSNPRMTVFHNGVKVHDNVELPGERSTTAARVNPGPGPGPIYLQNHGCPVRYRNIWVVETES
jgi:hypothetical protein